MRLFSSQRFLVLYSAVVTLAFSVTVLCGFVLQTKKAAFEQLDVQRINLVEPDGTLRMVISDHANFPGMIIRGKEQPLARPQAGMLFYNDEGTENGGLVFGGRRNANGEVVDAGVALSFDRYGGNSQFVQLAGVQDANNHFVGLTLSETDATRTRRRVVIGPDKEGVASMALMDRDGRKRIVLQV